jgi:hypothetical protein
MFLESTSISYLCTNRTKTDFTNLKEKEKGLKKTLALIIVGILCVSTFSIFAPKVKAAGLSLVGYWKFDEGSGNIAHDYSGSGNDGTIYGATWTDGRVGKALHFNGIDNWVRIPSNPTLSGLSQITLEAWIKEDIVATNVKGIISKCTGMAHPTYEAEYFLGPDGQNLVFHVSNYNHIAIGIVPGAINEANRWYHVAATWSGDSYTVYVDGIARESDTCTPQTTYSNTVDVQIGRHGTWSWVYFQGIIDEVKIYNYARTAEEIWNDYANPNWETSYIVSSGHPVVDFAVYNGSLYAAADNRLYVKDGGSWNVIDAPTFVTSLETVNLTSQQPPPAEWNQSYGGVNDEAAYALVQTSDGGYALAGYTRSFGTGSFDFYLVKTDALGNMQWNQTYDGGGTDWAYALVQTSDGGYALAGYTVVPREGGWSSNDFWLVKTDSSGNHLWNKTYGGWNLDEAYALVQTDDGGYALAGLTYSFDGGDGWLVKTDAAGNMQWNHTYGGYYSMDGTRALVQTSDGGYALAGWTSSGVGGADFWLVKTDSSGTEQWNQTYGGTDNDQACALVQTSDGGYALTGVTYSFGAGGYDFWLIKTDGSGSMQWNRTYGGAYADWAYALVQTGDGGYALAGGTDSFSAYGDFWLVKTDSAGNVQWNKTYGDGYYPDSAYALVQTDDGGYALAGSTGMSIAGPEAFLLVKTKAFDPYMEKLVLGGQGGLHCYNGASFDLIFQVPTYIRVLGVYDNRLYAGTMLADQPKLYYCEGSSENPANWYIDTEFSSILGSSGPFGSIDSFAVYDGVMYLSSGRRLYSFNGTDWSIAVSFDDVYAFLDMQEYDNKLYLATRDQGWREPIYQGGTGFSGRVIEFDGENWTTILDHDYWIYSLGIYSSKLYVGTVNKIFTYNGTTLEASFNATEGAYYALCFENYDNKIYVGMGNGYIFADPQPETSIAQESQSTIIPPLFMIFATVSIILIKRRLKRCIPLSLRSFGNFK